MTWFVCQTCDAQEGGFEGADGHRRMLGHERFLLMRNGRVVGRLALYSEYVDETYDSTAFRGASLHAW